MRYMIIDNNSDIEKVLQLSYGRQCAFTTVTPSDKPIAWNKENQPEVIQFPNLEDTTVNLFSVLKKSNPDADFVVYTGSPENIENSDKKKAEELGIHYIHKMVGEFPALNKYVQQMIDKHR